MASLAQTPEVNSALLQESEEKALFQELVNSEAICRDLLQRNDCQRYLGVLADLRNPMARFFDSVLVNAPDEALKQNRLAILLRVRQLYDTVADFSLVQVAGHG
jgi:glycyl-tRNA synthetase beta subunit